MQITRRVELEDRPEQIRAMCFDANVGRLLEYVRRSEPYAANGEPVNSLWLAEARAELSRRGVA